MWTAVVTASTTTTINTKKTTKPPNQIPRVNVRSWNFFQSNTCTNTHLLNNIINLNCGDSVWKSHIVLIMIHHQTFAKNSAHILAAYSVFKTTFLILFLLSPGSMIADRKERNMLRTDNISRREAHCTHCSSLYLYTFRCIISIYRLLHDYSIWRHLIGSRSFVH